MRPAPVTMPNLAAVSGPEHAPEEQHGAAEAEVDGDGGADVEGDGDGGRDRHELLILDRQQEVLRECMRRTLTMLRSLRRSDDGPTTHRCCR